MPHQKIKLGIQPLSVHSPGHVGEKRSSSIETRRFFWLTSEGIASRSGTISYELAAQTTVLGLGQSIVFGLGGDPFPATRTWEALKLMLDDPLTKVICLVGEIGGQSEFQAVHAFQFTETFQSRKRLRWCTRSIGGIFLWARRQSRW